MAQSYQPTTDELRQAWRDSGLWRIGHSFEQDSKEPMLMKALTNAVLARHKKNALPQQGRLTLELV